MPLTYYNEYMSGIRQTPKEDWHDGLEAIIDDQFYNSSNWYTIKEETSFASGVYVDLDVIINTVINSTTGANQGDDFRKLLFKDIDKPIRIGALFQFDNNYWLVVSTEALVHLTSTCIVRRCNETLRWIDLAGARHDLPCVLDYGIQENRDYSTGGSKIVNPSGLLVIKSQLNSETNLVVANDRFLFGNSNNWTVYKIQGGGIHNFNNYETEANLGEGLLTLTAGVDYENIQTDDLVNGYANATERAYTISLDISTISGQPTDTFQLSSQVYLNGDTVSRDVLWSSDTETIVTVSSTGLVTMIATGNAVITASLDGDETVYADCAVTVAGAPILEDVVTVSPDENFIYEEDTTTFSVYLEENGIVQADVFTFAIVSGNVPSANYVFTSIDGNSFSVQNVEFYMQERLVIRATSGANIKDVELLLKGAY